MRQEESKQRSKSVGPWLIDKAFERGEVSPELGLLAIASLAL
jgi:hypothetical protein